MVGVPRFFYFYGQGALEVGRSWLISGKGNYNKPITELLDEYHNTGCMKINLRIQAITSL